jgi:hypothetical protein
MGLALDVSQEVFVLGTMPTAVGFAVKIASYAVIAGWLWLIGAQRRTGDATGFIATVISTAVWLNLIVLIVVAASATGLSWEPAKPGLLHVASLFFVFFLLLGWTLSTVFVLGVRSSFGRSLRFGLGAAFAVVLSAAVQFLEVATAIDVAGLLKGVESEEDGEPAPRINIERTFARQAELIDRQLDTLLPRRADRANLYFVGMAPYASQDVFKREITAVREIVDDRLATRGRSVLMVNHADSAGTLPLASATNLERTLYRLAQLMEPERDVLMLFITTHGTEGLLSVDFPGFPLDNLTPSSLKDILDRTGIKNRVLVISACHSGSFIPMLEGPDTLILAAARGDRASFGCSNERDWTYFGDALFNHALRETTSLTAAFERAKALVTEWETREKMSPPSEPQMSIGANIAAKLDRLALDSNQRASSNP